MLKVTEWANTREELQYAVDQIEKYATGKSLVKERNGMFCVFRTDMPKPKGPAYPKGEGLLS